MASSNDSPSSRRRFIQQNWQIIYALVLILFVSVIVTANTLFVIGNFRNIIEVGLQQTALTMGKMFDVLNVGADNNPSVLQERSQKIATALPEIVSLDILAKDGADFFVVASLYEAGIGRLTRDEKNIQAWNDNKSLTYLTINPRSVSTNPKPTSDEIQSNQRFGGVIVPLHNEDGQISHLLSAKISSTATDSLVRSGLFWSYAWLTMTLLMVMLILILNTRLLKYVRLQKRLREADKVKDDFIAMAASELQAPLTAIRSNLSLLLEDAFGQIDKKPREIIGVTRSLTDRLETLVNDLLCASRLEQDHVEFNPKNIDAENIIEEVIEQLQQQAKNKSLQLKYRRPNHKLPQICVDPQHLKQALINICSNAIKFTPSGEIIITSLINDSQR
ncbi:HAMP domain-containing histidine kinase, partial [Patescibacteria group bacterium]|nr:HAMP domain-containing histidine kinase [Patescibacteria group bacterium]